MNSLSALDEIYEELMKTLNIFKSGNND